MRVEFDGDTTRYAEWSYPKILGPIISIDQASLEIPDKDIKP